MREERLQLIAKMEEYEKAGKLNLELNPPLSYQKLDPKRLDLMHKKLFSKIKSWWAYVLGEKFFRSLVKKRQIIFKEPQGLENLQGFQGGAVVTCNHIHMADSFGILLAMMQHFKHGKGSGKRQLIKIVAESNYSLPGMIGFIMRNADTLPVSSEEQPNLKLIAKTFQAAKNYLDRGKKLLIYPEANLWQHYRKPRPMKKGAFYMAAKFNVPIIPCFYTLADHPSWLDADGFPVQEYTLHVLPMIYPDPNLSVDANAEAMLAENTRLWREIYEKNYCKTK